jgi:phage shock protein PspC (stress-responsive transcriptional regulator)
MTDEAAQSRDAGEPHGPAPTGTGPSQDEPAPSATPPPPPPPPPGAGSPPPWFGAPDGPSFSRENLVRPAQGRYVAGVCVALGRATNTDPVLWRVLLAVLGFFGGVGVLIYLIGWIAIPAEGDTASPIESLLGRGRSGMKPASVVLLGGAAVLTFAFVVNDGFRAALLAVAVLVGAGMLLKRNAGAPSAPPSFTAPPPPSEQPTAAFATTAPAASGPAPAAAPAAEPVTAPLPPIPPIPPSAGPLPPQPPPGFAPPSTGYRPPFAPHGPWAGQAQQPYAAPAPPPKQPKPPKPPREKSKLGRITFFGVLAVMGLLALLDQAGLGVSVSAYFAAALTTIALGLIVGAWFGRARGLIALAVVATLGLGLSTGLERFSGQVGSNVYRPTSVAAVADRYDFTVGDAMIDLRGVDFTGAAQETTVEMKLGQVRIALPENVDATVDVRMTEGRAQIFGKRYDGRDVSAQQYTDLGPDGAGGGTVRLVVEMNTGNVEVSR